MRLEGVRVYKNYNKSPFIDGKNAVVGIIANPLSARDIRRLVSRSSGLQIADRANMVMRAITGLSAAGVNEIVIMPDKSGLAAMILYQLGDSEQRKKRFDSDISFIEMPVTGTVEDTTTAAKHMMERQIDAIITLGGDGTSRAVAEVVKDIPMMCMSTGTNNAFPVNIEATIAGLATGIIARELVDKEKCCIKNKSLHLYKEKKRISSALVDIAVTNNLWNGSLALWKPEMIDQLYVSFASPVAVGISSIAAQLEIIDRQDNEGLFAKLDHADDPEFSVMAPIAPGLIKRIGVKHYQKLSPGKFYPLESKNCSIAIDGERCVAVSESEQVEILIDRNGPITIDAPKTMEAACMQDVFSESHYVH